MIENPYYSPEFHGDYEMFDLGDFVLLGITMSGIPAKNVDFFPWSAVRQVSLLPNPGARQRAGQQQQQNPYGMEPVFPRVNF